MNIFNQVFTTPELLRDSSIIWASNNAFPSFSSVIVLTQKMYNEVLSLIISLCSILFTDDNQISSLSQVTVFWISQNICFYEFCFLIKVLDRFCIHACVTDLDTKLVLHDFAFKFNFFISNALSFESYFHMTRYVKFYFFSFQRY